MADFDIDGARKAGYSDAEIADHLAESKGFDTAAARKAGYTDAEIVAHLTPAPPKSFMSRVIDRISGNFAGMPNAILHPIDTMKAGFSQERYAPPPPEENASMLDKIRRAMRGRAPTPAQEELPEMLGDALTAHIIHAVPEVVKAVPAVADAVRAAPAKLVEVAKTPGLPAIAGGSALAAGGAAATAAGHIFAGPEVAALGAKVFKGGLDQMRAARQAAHVAKLDALRDAINGVKKDPVAPIPEPVAPAPSPTAEAAPSIAPGADATPLIPETVASAPAPVPEPLAATPEPASVPSLPVQPWQIGTAEERMTGLAPEVKAQIEEFRRRRAANLPYRAGEVSSRPTPATEPVPAAAEPRAPVTTEGSPILPGDTDALLERARGKFADAGIIDQEHKLGQLPVKGQLARFNDDAPIIDTSKRKPYSTAGVANPTMRTNRRGALAAQEIQDVIDTPEPSKPMDLEAKARQDFEISAAVAPYLKRVGLTPGKLGTMDAEKWGMLADAIKADPEATKPQIAIADSIKAAPPSKAALDMIRERLSKKPKVK